MWHGDVAQLVRACVLYTQCPRFESWHPYHFGFDASRGVLLAGDSNLKMRVLASLPFFYLWCLKFDEGAWGESV